MKSIEIQDLLDLADKCGGSVRHFRYQSTTSVAFKDEQLIEFARRAVQEYSEEIVEPVSVDIVHCAVYPSMVFIRAEYNVESSLRNHTIKCLEDYVKEFEESHTILVLFVNETSWDNYTEEYNIPVSDYLSVIVITDEGHNVSGNNSANGSVNYVHTKDSFDDVVTSIEKQMKETYERK